MGEQLLAWILIVGLLSITLMVARQKIIIWRKARTVSGKLVGYKFSGLHSMLSYTRHPARFWPIIKDKLSSDLVVVEGCNILIPEGTELTCRLTKKNHFITFNFHTELFIIFFSLLMLVMFASPKFISEHDYLFDVLVVLALTVFFISVIINLVYEKRTLGTFQNSFNFIWPRKPDGFVLLEKPELTALESQERVSYQEAMSHYYSTNKRAEKWLYLALGIVGLLLIWKFFPK